MVAQRINVCSFQIFWDMNGRTKQYKVSYEIGELSIEQITNVGNYRKHSRKMSKEEPALGSYQADSKLVLMSSVFDRY